MFHIKLGKLINGQKAYFIRFDCKIEKYHIKEFKKRKKCCLVSQLLHPAILHPLRPINYSSILQKNHGARELALSEISLKQIISCVKT